MWRSLSFIGIAREVLNIYSLFTWRRPSLVSVFLFGSRNLSRILLNDDIDDELRMELLLVSNVVCSSIICFAACSFVLSVAKVSLVLYTWVAIFVLGLSVLANCSSLFFSRLFKAYSFVTGKKLIFQEAEFPCFCKKLLFKFPSK